MEEKVAFSQERLAELYAEGLKRALEPYINNVTCGVRSPELDQDVHKFFKQFKEDHGPVTTIDGKVVEDLRVTFKKGQCYIWPVLQA